jgi:hypothetical protein
MRLVSLAAVLALIFVGVLSQEFPPDVRNADDRSCAERTGDEFRFCKAASLAVELDDRDNIEPGLREMQQIDADAINERDLTFSPWFTQFTSASCDTVLLQNMSDALTEEIGMIRARIAEAQANITEDIQAALASWLEHYENFSKIVEQFQPPNPEPAPRVKLFLFVTAFQLSQERRILEINIFRVRLAFAIAEVHLNHLRTRKTVVNFLLNTSCSTITDRADVESVVLTLIRARRVFAFKLARIELLVQSFLVRHEAVMQQLRQRVTAAESDTYKRAPEVVKDWQGRPGAIADAIRRAVIAFFNVTRVTVTVIPNGPGERPTVSISFDRTAIVGEARERLKIFIQRIVRTAMASQSGADEETVEVDVSDPTDLKRQLGQSFTVVSRIGNSSAAIAVSALALVACVLALLI